MIAMDYEKFQKKVLEGTEDLPEKGEKIHKAVNKLINDIL